MRRLVLLFVVLLAPLAHAELADDARAFLLPDEEVVDATTIHYAGGWALVVKGSAGSLVLLDNVTGGPLSPDEAVGALSDVRLALSPAEVGEFVARANAFSSNVAACRQVYNDFATGAGSNCLETSYYKYRCGFLWSTGFWKGIIGFSIIEAKTGVDSGLMEMGNSSRDLIAAGLRLAAGDPTAAGPAAAALEKTRAGYGAFSAQHAKMVSYPPFATTGRLNRCSLGSADIDRMNDIIGSYLDADTGEGKDAIRSRIAQVLKRGATAYYSTWALARLDDYASRASEFNSQFSTVRGARALFSFSDEENLRNLASSDAASYDDAIDRTRAFSQAYSLALNRIAAARTLMDDYRAAARALGAIEEPTGRALAKADPKDAQQIANLVTRLETDFIVLEQNLRINGNGTLAEFQNVTAQLNAQAGELDRQASNPSLSREIPGVSTTELIGFALLVAVAGALSYQYYRSRQ